MERGEIFAKKKFEQAQEKALRRFEIVTERTVKWENAAKTVF